MRGLSNFNNDYVLKLWYFGNTGLNMLLKFNELFLFTFKKQLLKIFKYMELLEMTPKSTIKKVDKLDFKR
jgi:hypothetical protein